MADVTVAGVDAGQGRNSQFGLHSNVGLFCKTDQILYAFWLDTGDAARITKSTDGGQTWNDLGEILGNVGGGTGDHEGITGWADWTTYGYSANERIHAWSLNASGTMGIYYNYLDTASDTFGSPVTVFAGGATGQPPNLAGCRAIGGNLYIRATKPAGTTISIFYRSTDNGANWTSRAIASDDAIGDQYRLLPSNNADTNDIWNVRFDSSSFNFEFDRYDDSANTWASTAFGTSITGPNSSGIGTISSPGYDAKIRYSDYHIIVVAMNTIETATSDMITWDITPNGTGVPTVTAKTDVITNSDDVSGCTIFINQLNNDIYVSYLGKAGGAEVIGTSVSVNYKKSTNGMTSWGSEVQYSASTGFFGSNYGCIMGATSGRFIPCYMDHTNFLNLVNYDNSIAFTGVTPALLVLGTIAGLSDATLVLSTPAIAADLILGQIDGISNVVITLSVPAMLVLGQVDGVATVTVTLTAPVVAFLILDQINGLSSVSNIVLGAPSLLVLGQINGLSSATLILSTQALLVLGVISGVATVNDVGISTPGGFLPLVSIAGLSTVTVLLSSPILLTLGVSAGLSTVTLILTANALLTLSTVAGLSNVTLLLTSPVLLILGNVAGLSSVSVTLISPILLTLSTIAGLSTVTLALTANVLLVLGTVAGLSNVTALLTTPSGFMILSQVAGLSTVTITLTTPAMLILNLVAGIALVTLALRSPTLLTLSTVQGTSTVAVTVYAPSLLFLSMINGTSTIQVTLVEIALLILSPINGIGFILLSLTTPQLVLPWGLKYIIEGLVRQQEYSATIHEQEFESTVHVQEVTA